MCGVAQSSRWLITQLTNGQHACLLVFLPHADILNVLCGYLFNLFSINKSRDILTDTFYHFITYYCLIYQLAAVLLGLHQPEMRCFVELSLTDLTVLLCYFNLHQTSLIIPQNTWKFPEVCVVYNPEGKQKYVQLVLIFNEKHNTE